MEVLAEIHDRIKSEKPWSNLSMIPPRTLVQSVVLEVANHFAVLAVAQATK